MTDDADMPISKGGEPKPPKVKADPWYLLATLYGVPELGDYALQKKNRVAWNRYFSAGLTEETRARLVSEQRRATEELTPFSAKDLHEVEVAFAVRCKGKLMAFALPQTDSIADFRKVEFDRKAYPSGSGRTR